MSTINRFLTRRDKYHGASKEKVMASPATALSTSSSASLSSRCKHTSTSSLSSISLAFNTLLLKRSPSLQATIVPVQCGGADPTTLLLQPKHDRGSLNGLFDSEEKIKTLLQRLSNAGIATFKEADAAYVLAGAYAQGDTEKAYELLILLEDSEQGIIRKYNPDIKLLGAINREGVTCWLDALLFAMFARLGSFEAMLFKNIDDPPRKRLAMLLRLWVNILRAGKLVTTDITKQIQLQLSECGWKEAEELCQHDASEAFTFITSTLALPLLTLKMDIFHTGKEDVTDDHKLINERLLELAIPDEPLDGHVITLEECLEMFFNNKIEVKRYLDHLERRNTLNSMRSRRSADSVKVQSSHVEVAEIGDISPSASPIVVQPQPSTLPVSPPRPTLQRKRAPSIIREHYIDEKKGLHEIPPSINEHGLQPGRVRKEVIMPAWQFFSLIPWYTNNTPSNDAQVAAHFSSTRPILGICLKRYSMLPNGNSVKRTTRIDIPLEIALPHFIRDDNMAEDGPAFGNFKLSLQSVVCHQGMSTGSGHYISLVRSPNPDQPGMDRWMRFDDLAYERVTYTNVETFLLQESPYLLFYQVMPIEGDPGNVAANGFPVVDGEQPPAYSESNASQESKFDSGVSGLSTNERFSYTPNEGPLSDSQRPSVEIYRPPSDISMPEDGERGRSSMASDRPQSINLSDANMNTPTGGKNGFLNAPALDANPTDSSQTTQPISISRPSSRSDDKRMSSSLSRLASRMSKDRLNRTSGSTTNIAGSRDSINLPSRQFGESTVPTNEKAAAAGDKWLDRARQKKDSSDQSRAAHREHQHLLKGKRREGKPDRECSVM